MARVARCGATWRDVARCDTKSFKRLDMRKICSTQSRTIVFGFSAAGTFVCNRLKTPGPRNSRRRAAHLGAQQRLQRQERRALRPAREPHQHLPGAHALRLGPQVQVAPQQLLREADPRQLSAPARRRHQRLQQLQAVADEDVRAPVAPACARRNPTAARVAAGVGKERRARARHHLPRKRPLKEELSTSKKSTAQLSAVHCGSGQCGTEAVPPDLHGAGDAVVARLALLAVEHPQDSDAPVHLRKGDGARRAGLSGGWNKGSGWNASGLITT
eukprot:8057032-Pyramimonas_sp.AAC.1